MYVYLHHNIDLQILRLILKLFFIQQLNFNLFAQVDSFRGPTGTRAYVTFPLVGT